MTIRAISWVMLTLLFSGCFFKQSCGDDDKYLGALELEEESIQSYPPHYGSIAEIKFFNESNVARSYSVVNYQREGRINFEQLGTCKYEPHDTYYSYYVDEQIVTELTAPDDYFSITLKTTAWIDNLLYDIIEISHVSERISWGRMSFVTSYRDHQMVDSDFGLYDTLYQELTLRGRNFSNVYQSIPYDSSSFYYAVGYGIIATKEGDELWLVEE